jgi:hypothetical protein
MRGSLVGRRRNAMPERQSRHSDNDLIDKAEHDSMPGAQGKLQGEEIETAVGSDNHEEDARKGPKTIEHMIGGGSSPSR